MIRTILFSSLMLAATLTNAQTNWQLKSPAKNKICGASVEEAYKQLKGRTPKTVIVAVIDIGTDITHEDLKDMIWTNPKEIAGNGIDDDHNGYVDDIHGWNFIGGKNGNLVYEATEETRMYQALQKQWIHRDTTNLKGDDSVAFAQYKKARRKYIIAQKERESDAKSMTTIYNLNQQWFWRQIFHLAAGGKQFDKDIAEAKEMTVHGAAYNKINVDSQRIAIVGDDPANPHEHYYGNNQLYTPESSHGTHTAGIIAAVRNNGIGINGVTNDVRIMVLRAVPWGDERDKDIANAIRYAADNGASIINMSFGKYKSPDKSVVDSAIAYATAKDVLFIHSSGNESKNIDTVASYPSSREALADANDANWIEVGANGKKKGKKLVASFSNYGQHAVDIFAPGENIYATLPNNQYGKESGTSMAGPVVAGVAAMILAYFPELSAAEVKSLLLKTAYKYDGKVRTPGHKKMKVKFSTLSVSGGIIDAAAAVDAALRERKLISLQN